MDIGVSLYEGDRVRLSGFDLDKDSAVIARWTQDPVYLHLAGAEPVRPLAAGQVKKKLEAQAKEAQEGRRRFDFALRLKDDGRLIGSAALEGVEWSHGNAWLRLALGEPADRGRGYGGEAVRLLLRYGFYELNLFRLTAECGQDNPGGLRFLERQGFTREVCRRQALYRAGQRWDEYRLGLLRAEWEARS